MTKQKNILIFLIAMCLFGCAGGKEMWVGKDYNMGNHPDKSIVFGEIGLKDAALIDPNADFIDLYNTKSGKRTYVNLGWAGNNFYITLPAGEYEITGIGRFAGLVGELMGMMLYDQPVKAKFTVNSNQQVVYIGKLQLEVVRDYCKQQVIVDSGLTVFDEYDSATKKFRSQYPNIKNDISKNLIECISNCRTPGSPPLPGYKGCQ